MIPDNFIGAHLPTQGGIYTIFHHAKKLNIKYIQCFTKNNRQWHFEKINEEDVANYQKARKELKIPTENIFSHASYLINCAAPLESEVHENSKKALSAELERCDQLGIKWTVIHPGSYKLSNTKDGLNLIAKTIDMVLSQTDTDSGVLLENSAGQGSTIPYTIEDLGYLLHLIAPHHKNRIGVCIDTCHAWAVGYNLSSKEESNNFWHMIDKKIGLDYIKLIHTNDSMKELGSRLDRHAHIGQGKMGKIAFEWLMYNKKLEHIPKILETPYDKISELIPDIEALSSFI